MDLAKKVETVTKFAKRAGDIGPTEAQVAFLTARITELTEHSKIYKKDFSSRLGLLKLAGQRKRLLNYLKRKDHQSYIKIITELKPRDK